MKKVCKSNDWDIKLKAKKRPSFKPDSELADKVNIMHVDIEENEDEQHESAKVKLALEKKSKERIELSLASKSVLPLKGNSEVSEKLDGLDIELLEEITDELEISTVKLQLKAKEHVHRSIEISKKAKPRFKHGSDLTEKVNIIDVEVNDTIEGDFEVCEISIKIKSNVCVLSENIIDLN